MAFWSRSPDLIGRIGCALCFGFFVGPLSWQERSLAGDLERDISINKAAFSFFWRLVFSVLNRGADCLLVKPSIKLWWSKLDGFGDSGKAFFNKRFHYPPCFLSGDAVFGSLLLAGRGGEEDGGGPTAAVWLRQDHLLLIRAHHMADMLVTMICGSCRSRRRFNGAFLTSKSEALNGVFRRRCTPPNNQVVSPRLLVAGGRWRSSDDIDIDGDGEGAALDCVSSLLAGSFLLNLKDQFVISFLRGPLCNLYPSPVIF